MNWYLFEDDALAGCRVYSAVDTTGKALFANDIPTGVPECYVDVAKEGKMTDRLYSIGRDLVLREKSGVGEERGRTNTNYN